MALIRGGAHDRARARAHAGLTGIDGGAGVPVVAGYAVRHARIAALPVRGVAGAGDMALV